MSQLVLYYRSGCSLCEDMHRELLQLASLAPEQLRCIDVDTDVLLTERYGHKVPVLTGAADEEICHYFLDPEALHRYFATH